MTILRYPVVLTTVEEDFRKIGILPSKALMEVDDPAKPREVPSPDPSTLKGLDDSQGKKDAHTQAAKQPKPKVAPDEDDAEKSGYEPLEGGGSKGAQKGGKGGYHKVAGGKEASIKGEAKEGPKPVAPLKKHSKDVHPQGKGKNKGQPVKGASGLKPTKKIAGMKQEGVLGKAATLIEQVQGILHSVQLDEEVDNMMRGFRLVSENAALLADRLTEISHLYETERLVSAMEELSTDAAEALEAVEAEIADGNDEGDENAAIANSARVGTDHVEDVEDMDEEDDKKDKNGKWDSEKCHSIEVGFKEQSDAVLQHMVKKLMDALEAYDGALDDMGYGGEEPQEADAAAGAELDAYEGEDEPQDDEPEDDEPERRADDDDEREQEPERDDEPEDGGGGGGIADRMAALRAKREQMRGAGGPSPQFR